MSDAEVSTVFPTLGTSFHKCKDNESPRSSNEENSQPINTTRKTLIGLAIVICLAVSWVGAQQFAQSANTAGNFSAPYFTTWFSTCWMTLCYPLYCLFILIVPAGVTFNNSIRQSLQIFGPERMKFRQIFTIVLPFNIGWIATNYLYVYALTFIAATDASAIISSNVAFVYAFSFVWLREQFYIIRVIASLFCIGGVVLFGYADGFGDTSNMLPGILMAIFSALGSATYKVIFKRVVGFASLGQVSLFLTLLGLTNIVFLWLIFLILYLTGVEKMVDIPWDYLCGSSTLSLVFNFLVDFGVAFTYPLFISIAMMLGIPLNAAVDLLFRGMTFSVFRLVAALLVVLGFCLMMCPDTWNLPLHRPFKCTSTRCYRGPPENEDEAPLTYSSGNLKPESHNSTSVDK